MDISIRGQVRSYHGSPISMIKVSVCRGAELITHGYIMPDPADNLGMHDVPHYESRTRISCECSKCW
jgi:hypothetical protein